MLRKWLLYLFPTLILPAMVVLSACQPIQIQAASGQTTPPLDEIKAYVLERDTATFDHARTHDVAAVESETSKDFIWINSEGARLGYAEYVAGAADEKLSMAEDIVWGEPEFVAVSPDYIKLIRSADYHGTYDGVEFAGHEYITSIWEKRDGTWLNVFLQASPIKSAQADPAQTDSCFGCDGTVQQEPAQEAAAPMLPWDQLTIELKIANAMTGGPAAVSRYARIVDWPSEMGGEMPVLREGSNGWTCMTDDAAFPYATPLNDPLCYDEAWAPWFESLFAGTEPVITRPGVVYSYPGTISIDNDDPFAAEPPAGKGFDLMPPHVGLVFPGGLGPDDFPSDMHLGMPYIMYGETPYEHLMMPLVTSSLAPVDPADRIGNAMSAAPPEIGQDAAILDWPTEPGADWTVLREGANGWTCLPDDNTLATATPTNDPMCLDATFMAWMKAMVAGQEPDVTRPGVGYMFQGGSNADNDDPSILVPPAGGAWNIEPPHLMAINPEPLDPAMSRDPNSGGPYVMYAGTPYEHLMIPVDPVAVGGAAE